MNRLTFLIPLAFLLTGCSTISRLKTPLAEVTAPKDSGKPATLDTASSGETLPLPKGSELVIVKTEAQPAIPATETAPAVQPTPATETTTVKLAQDSSWTRQNATVKAVTASVDQTVALKKIDAESKAGTSKMIGWIFYGLGALLIAGGAAMFLLGSQVPFLGPRAALSVGGAGGVLILTGIVINELIAHPAVIWIGIGLAAVALAVSAALMYANHHHQSDATPPTK